MFCSGRRFPWLPALRTRVLNAPALTWSDCWLSAWESWHGPLQPPRHSRSEQGHQQTASIQGRMPSHGMDNSQYISHPSFPIQVHTAQVGWDCPAPFHKGHWWQLSRARDVRIRQKHPASHVGQAPDARWAAGSMPGVSSPLLSNVPSTRRLLLHSNLQMLFASSAVPLHGALFPTQCLPQCTQQ